MAEVALNCAGFFVGLLIMTGDYVVARRSLNQENWEFLASPKAMVWIILVAGQFAFWATIVQPLWGRLSRLRLDYGLRRTREIRVKFAAAIIFFALPGFFLVRIVPDSNLAHHDLKMAIVNFTAMIVSLIAVMGIWYVRVRPRRHVRVEGSRREACALRPRGDAGPPRSARRLAVVHHAVGGDGRPGRAGQGCPAAGVPRHGRQSRGIPVGIRCSSKPRISLGCWPSSISRRTRSLPPSVPTSSSLPIPITAPDLDWENLSRLQANRKSLKEILQLGSGAVDNLRASVSILSPVATSVITVLLGTK